MKGGNVAEGNTTFDRPPAHGIVNVRRVDVADVSGVEDDRQFCDRSRSEVDEKTTQVADAVSPNRSHGENIRTDKSARHTFQVLTPVMTERVIRLKQFAEIGEQLSVAHADLFVPPLAGGQLIVSFDRHGRKLDRIGLDKKAQLSHDRSVSIPKIRNRRPHGRDASDRGGTDGTVFLLLDKLKHARCASAMPTTENVKDAGRLVTDDAGHGVDPTR